MCKDTPFYGFVNSLGCNIKTNENIPNILMITKENFETLEAFNIEENYCAVKIIKLRRPTSDNI